MAAFTYTTEDTSDIHVLPVNGRHFDFRHGFLSSVIFVIGGNSAVLKNIIPITVSLVFDISRIGWWQKTGRSYAVHILTSKTLFLD